MVRRTSLLMLLPKIPLPQRALVVTALAVAAEIGLVSCRRSPPTPAIATATASASASAAPKDTPPPPRCKTVDSDGLRVTLGAPAPAASAEEGDDGIGLPFSPEIGGAVPFEGGFL